MFTKPDKETPIFAGDKIIVMGELNNRESSPYLKDIRKKLRSQNTINLSRKKSFSKRSESLLVKKANIAETAVLAVDEDEKNEASTIPDEELMNMIKNMLDKTKRERELISKQNETILNLASEYTTVQKLLSGGDINESLSSDLSSEEIQPIA